MNEPSVHTVPTESPESHVTRPRYSTASEAIITDTSISDTALRAYVLLDLRAGASGTCRTGLKRIAVDIGISERAARRAVAELKEAGWISVKRTGRTSIYSVFNPSRPARSPRVDTHGRSDRPQVAALQNKSVLTTSSVPTEVTKPTQSAAQHDAGERSQGAKYAAELRALLPITMRPDPTSEQNALLDQAVTRGWTVAALAEQIISAVDPGRYDKPAGVVITKLRAMARSEPPAAKPQRPTHCGVCDPVTRWVYIDGDESKPQRCPVCHSEEARKESAA